ncbi:hypothetical protein BKA70DRAFT_1482618 [Coprinopsis sp. MPI-PUGE-AT-0042]|nr:hypothetical protein BKA70DRAFT_1482618 [Coprinopsis sp. MPI-PUGE-AT-0042]
MRGDLSMSALMAVTIAVAFIFAVAVALAVLVTDPPLVSTLVAFATPVPVLVLYQPPSQLQPKINDVRVLPPSGTIPIGPESFVASEDACFQRR